MSLKIVTAFVSCSLIMAASARAEDLRPSNRADAVQNDPALLKFLSADYYPSDLQGDVIHSVSIDLNQDGQAEQIVELGKGYCGTAGCETMILMADADGAWKILFDDHVTKLETLDSSTDGWVDLEVEGLTSGTYIYNGDIYAPKS